MTLEKVLAAKEFGNPAGLFGHFQPLLARRTWLSFTGAIGTVYSQFCCPGTIGERGFDRNRPLSMCYRCMIIAVNQCKVAVVNMTGAEFITPRRCCAL